MTIQFVSQLAVFTDDKDDVCFVNFGKQKVSDFGSVLRDSFQLKTCKVFVYFGHSFT